MNTSELLAEGFALHFVGWAKEVAAPASSLPILKVAARLLSLALQDGHVCVHCNALQEHFPTLTLDQLRQALFDSKMLTGEGEGQPVLPLVLDRNDRLYLYRYFDYERRLARQLVQRAAPLSCTLAPTPLLLQTLQQQFAHNEVRLEGRADWQKIAAALALRGRLTIISGGPGTGKTSTVVALLACLLQENPALRIALAAPTGKAAARMLEALRKRASDLPIELKQALPQESFTLHRLLGVTSDPGRFRHHAGNPLPVDALIVDEASMLDLALATRLFEAVPPEARLILLGDKDQLAAVDAGAVFAEVSADPALSALCVEQLAELTNLPSERILAPVGQVATPLNDAVVWFSESHRFAKNSGIGRLAADINQGQGVRARAWMAAGEESSVRWLQDDPADSPAKLGLLTLQALLDGYQAYVDVLIAALGEPAHPVGQQDLLRRIFATFDQFRVLCAVREGPRGVHAVNQLLSTHLQRQLEVRKHDIHSEWYPGRPIIVLRNDYVTKLFNGDIGICLPAENNELMIYFPLQEDSIKESAGLSVAHSLERNSFRAVAPLRLPEHDSAFALTVHKSQGSEFDHVLLLLPQENSRILTRELLYTGVTRAAKTVTLAGSEAVFLSACANPTHRHSGLITRMYEEIR